MVLRLLLMASAIFSVLLPLYADALFFAGKEIAVTSSYILEKNELFAPSSVIKSAMAGKVTVHGDSVAIAVPGVMPIALTIDQPEATIGDEPFLLPQPARCIDKQLYLPLRSLMQAISYDVQYDVVKRRAMINPRLSVSYEMRDNGMAVMVHSALPLKFSSGKLLNPPRVYFDFENSSLGLMAQQIPVDTGGLQRLRLAQFSPDSSVVRVALDLTNQTLIPAVSYSTSTDGCQLTIQLNKAKELAEEVIPVVNNADPPIPPEETPPDPVIDDKNAEPVTPELPTGTKITGACLQNYSAKYSELRIATGGCAKVTSTYQPKSRLLTLVIPEGINELPAALLEGLSDKVVAKVVCQANPGNSGVTFNITLQSDLPFGLFPMVDCIRITVGIPELKNCSIVLDPGHGGKDSGAVGRSGLMEKVVNLDVVLRTAEILRKSGATVYLTRDNDSYPELRDRTALANGKGANFFVSVHANASVNRNVGGLETIYRSPQSASLANNLQNAMVAGLGLANRKAYTDVRGLHVLRVCQMPSALVELGFLSNAKEEALLKTTEFRQRCAESIAAGITAYLLSP